MTWSNDDLGVASTASGRRVGLLGDERVRVEELEDALGAGARLLGDRDDAGEHAHRREQLHEVGGEREERAERDLALDREPAAEREHADLAERGDRLQRATEYRAWSRTVRTRDR